MTHKRLVAAGALGATVIGAATVMSLSGGGPGEPAAASEATRTATIRQQDLVESETVAGTLGYSDARTVLSRLSGTVTWMPAEGSVVRTGQRLYAVDGKSVYLLDGTFPAYRTLRAGLDGDDVHQFERNMRELGHDPGHAMTIDGTWDAGTTAAAKRWQDSKGMDDDGTIESGKIVFAPASRRVSEVKTPVGSGVSGAEGGGGADPGGGGGAGTELMTTTSTKRIVSVDLETTKQALARRGARVVVELPGGRAAGGRIARVGKVAQKKTTAENEDPPATIELVIKLRGSKGSGLDQAPVDVRLERRRAKDALTVPVTALLARAGGTFAVEVRDGAGRRIVPVQTGIYTDSYVEIEGRGLRPGLTVTDSGI